MCCFVSQDDGLTTKIREAWHERLRFPAGDLPAVREPLLARLGAPDWLLAMLPPDTLATLSARRSVGPRNPPPSRLGRVG
jgi:hypothetical protein